MVKLGAGLVAAGLALLAIDRLFYNGIDETGALRDSFFLPLGAIALLCGLGLLFIIGLRRLTGR